MKRVALRLAITLLTFLIGFVITRLLAVPPIRSTENMPALVPAVIELRVKPKHPEGWKRIDVENAFSFYVPPDMEQVDLPGCPFGAGQNFANQSLWVGYDYIPKGMMEYGYRGKLSCEVLEGPLTDPTIKRVSEVEIGGRRAREIFRQPVILTRNQISLCFPNLGSGALLSFRAGAGDERTMDVARQVVDSLEFR